MVFKIILTGPLKQDLREASQYISTKYSAAPGAKKYVDDIYTKIIALRHFPEGHPVYEGHEWKGLPLRTFTVRKHKVFYIVDNGRHEVVVLRAIYSRKNLKSILKNFHDKRLLLALA